MQSDTISQYLILWKFRSESSAFITYFLNAASPCFNISRPVKDVGYIRIIEDGIMRLHQCFRCPSIRKYTSITDDHFLILNPNLNRCAKHITVMSNCIVDYFADCLTRSMLRHLYRGHSGSICPRGSIAPDGCQIIARRHHSFAEIGQQPCFYLFICGLTESPIASRLRSEGISPKSIVSTLMLPKLIFTFAMSRHRFNDSISHHCPQKIRGSGCFNINHLHHI